MAGEGAALAMPARRGRRAMSAVERMMMRGSDGQLGRDGVAERKGDRVGSGVVREYGDGMWWKVDREMGLTRLI